MTQVLPRSARWVVPIATLLSLVGWLLLHRWWFMAGDDYLLITQGGHVAGRFGPTDWFGFLVNEWTKVNGRTSDSLLRLVLRPGPWFYPLFGPVMLTAVGLGIGALLATTRRPGDRSWVYAAGLLLIPFLAWLYPPFSGDAIFWTAGAMNYVLPLGGIALGLTGVVLVLNGRDPSWWLVAGTAVVLVLTDCLQEIASSSLGAVAVVVILTKRGRLPLKGWVLALASLLAFAVHMSAPGLWARTGQVAEITGAGTVERLIHAVALSSSAFWTRTAWVWLLLGAALLWLGFKAVGRRWPAFAAAGVLAGFAVFSQMYVHRAPADDAFDQALPAGLWPHSVLLVGFLAATFLLCWVAFADAAETLGWTPVVTWAAFVGSTVFIFGSGVAGPRTHFLLAALLLVTLLALGSALTRELVSSSSRTLGFATCGVMAIASLIWADSAWVGLQANYKAVQEQVVGPLLAAEPGATVVLPSRLPALQFSYGNAFLMPRYEEALKIYYDLPRDISIEQS